MRHPLIAATGATALVLGLAVAPGEAAPSKAYTVSITTSKATTEAEDFITVSGRVGGPGVKGSKVKIQRAYVGGSFRTVATVKLPSSGRYSARVETPRGGTTTFRVLKGSSSRRTAAKSASKKVKVFEWLHLAEQTEFVFPGSQSTDRRTGSVSIAGTTYRRSVVLGQAITTIAFQINEQCTRYSARMGPTNDSADGASVTGGVSEYKQTGPGSIHSVEVVPDTSLVEGQSLLTKNAPISGYFLFLTTTAVEAGADLAFGDARVYCNLPRLSDA